MVGVISWQSPESYAENEASDGIENLTTNSETQTSGENTESTEKSNNITTENTENEGETENPANSTTNNGDSKIDENSSSSEKTGNEGSSQSTGSSSQENSNAKVTQATSVQKSENAYLSNLGIRPNDFKGFTPKTMTYDVTVPENIETVEVYAQAQNAKAQITGTGNKNLNKGKNAVEVVVTAENGEQKTYTINITRGSEKTETIDDGQTDKQEQSNGLASLIINQLKLEPEFKSNVYEYKVKYIGEDNKLDIKAEPTSEDYIVEIIGNEDLKEGENTITILVSENNGNNVATYQITVQKSLIDEEAIAIDNARKQAEQRKKNLIGTVLGVVIIAIIICVIVRQKKKYAYDDLYDYEDDEEFEDNNNEDYKEELPNALKNEEYEEQMAKISKRKGKRFK